MTADDRVILIVDSSTERSEKLKSLVEFMDAPCVVTSRPKDCGKRIVAHRLAAVFVSTSLQEQRMNELIEEIGRNDPNVPIVLVDNAGSA